MVASFIQDTMDGPLGARQTELANNVSRCAEALASPLLDEGHHRRFLLWCQHRRAPTIAVRKRCSARATELCLVLLRIDALHSKLKGSFAWPTTARREHLTTHPHPRLLQLRSQHPCFRGLEWVEPIFWGGPRCGRAWCEGKRSSRQNQKLQIKPREGTM